MEINIRQFIRYLEVKFIPRSRIQNIYKWLITCGILNHRDVADLAIKCGNIPILNELYLYDKSIFGLIGTGKVYKPTRDILCAHRYEYINKLIKQTLRYHMNSNNYNIGCISIGNTVLKKRNYCWQLVHKRINEYYSNKDNIDRRRFIKRKTINIVNSIHYNILNFDKLQKSIVELKTSIVTNNIILTPYYIKAALFSNSSCLLYMLLKLHCICTPQVIDICLKLYYRTARKSLRHPNEQLESKKHN